MSELRLASLETIADIVMGQSPAGDTTNSEGVGMPLLNGPTEFRQENPLPCQWTSQAARLARRGDILFCVRGSTTGRMNTADQSYAIGRGLAAIRGKQAGDTEFIRYAITFTLSQLLAKATGSTFPNLSRGDIGQQIIPVPEPETRRAIAEVLGALDEKIAANTKLVSLIDAHLGLEYTAAVLDSASALPLSEVAEFHNRKRVPLSARERDQRRGDVPYYGASGVFGTVDTAIFDEPLVLVGEDGSVINDDGTPVSQYIWGPAWVNNHAHVLTGKGISTELLFLAIRRAQVATLVTGAVQPKINMGNLKRLALEIPSVDRRGRLEQIVKAETASKRAAIEENQTLAATRDALLPQFMSGKLRVKDAEKVLENAGV